jgi:hypothetical protein
VRRPLGGQELQDLQLGQMPALQRLRNRPRLMAAGIVRYRGSGGVDFIFRFAWIPRQKTWRVYIEQQPSYGSRPAGAHASHRLGLPNRPYVCWTKPLPTYDDARSVAALWADATQLYIAGGTFAPPPQGTRNVQDLSSFARNSEEQLRTALTEGGTIKPPTATRTPIRRLLERIG